MRLFLFKILLRLTCWVASNRPRVNRLFDIYLEEIKRKKILKMPRKTIRNGQMCSAKNIP